MGMEKLTTNRSAVADESRGDLRRLFVNECGREFERDI
jgi:hypothetical protein